MDALTIVRRVAAECDGVVTLAQARAAGFTVHEVQRLCRAGRWRAIARGGYLVDADRHDGIPRRARIRAAVSVSDLILREERYTAVSLLDSALHRGLVSADELQLVRSLLRGRRGAVAARAYLAEANGLAQSPLETRTRLRCVDGKVPPDALQLEVRDHDGYLIGVGDMGWRAPRLIAEADGRASHGTAEALFADRHRQNRLLNAGWTVLRFTWADTLRPDYIPWTIRQAILAAQRSRS